MGGVGREEGGGGGGGGSGGTGTEAGIAMGGVGVVVEYQSIDIIEQRRPAARASRGPAVCSCWLAAGQLLPTDFLHTRTP